MKLKKRLAIVMAAVVALAGAQAAIAETVDTDISVLSKKFTIQADTDFDNNNEMPIVAMVGKPLNLTITAAGNITVSVVGANGYNKVIEKDKGNKYVWTPQVGDAGIYTLRVVDKQGRSGERKIYVNGETIDLYYQFSEVGFQKVEAPVTTSSSYMIKDPDKAVFGTQLFQQTQKTNPLYKFTIGELGIWSRTIRNSAIQYDTNNVAYIAEGDGFQLDSGNYFFKAEVRNENSIEAEEFMKDTYNRQGHQVNIELTQSGNTFSADAKCMEEGCNDPMVYAFLVHDDLGTKVPKNYSESSQYTHGAVNWDYTVEARAKHKTNSVDNGTSELLAKSYEATDSIKVTNTQADALRIKQAGVIQYSANKYYNEKDSNISNPGFVKEIVLVEGQHGEVIANNKNYITVEVETTPLGTGESLSYKAWVVDDGVHIPLEMYEDKFVYYPKSGGSVGTTSDTLATETHKLVIAVAKRAANGNVIAQTSKTYELDVVNK